MESLIDLDDDLADLEIDDWFGRLAALGDEHGEFLHLGPHHSCLFIDAGPQLVVTFDSVASIRATQPRQAPFGLDLVRRNGWSLLSLVSDGDTWFRAPAVYGHIDRLIDDGFFEDFNRVLFCGAGAGGYAAAAFSVAAPGATVLALRPQATLDPAIAGWDTRFVHHRRRDFASRYGYAPDMLDAAQRAFVVFDPADTRDAMHAALFHRDNVTALRAAHVGAPLEAMLALTGIFAPLIESAMRGTLDRAGFARMWRARRGFKPYLDKFLTRVEAREKRLAAALPPYRLTPDMACPDEDASQYPRTRGTDIAAAE